MTTGNRVLLIGFDPRSMRGMDADRVERAMTEGEARLADEGFAAEYCLVGSDDRAEARIVDALSRGPYDCVVIGGGIRKPEPQLELFERVVNLVHFHSPRAAIAFNSSGENSVDAVLRWLPSPLAAERC